MRDAPWQRCHNMEALATGGLEPALMSLPLEQSAHRDRDIEHAVPDDAVTRVEIEYELVSMLVIIDRVRTTPISTKPCRPARSSIHSRIPSPPSLLGDSASGRSWRMFSMSAPEGGRRLCPRAWGRCRV